MAIPDLDWQRPGLLTRGQTKAKYGHWAVPGWAPAPDGGMYWIMPDDMSTYDPWRYDPNDPSRSTWQAWVLYTDGRPPVQLVREADDKSSESAYNKVIAHKNAWYADRDDFG
jgi:hypothetical protein